MLGVAIWQCCQQPLLSGYKCCEKGWDHQRDGKYGSATWFLTQSDVLGYNVLYLKEVSDAYYVITTGTFEDIAFQESVHKTGPAGIMRRISNTYVLS